MEWINVRVLLFFAFFAATLAQCPPASLILPCTCSHYTSTFVECAKIYDMDVLVNVFERSGDRKFYNLGLYESSIMYLPAEAISSKDIGHIFITNSTLTALFDSNPGTDNKIENIILKNVRFQRRVGWEMFKNVKLEEFKAEDTEIKSLGKSFVENINPGLTILSLLNAKVKKIYPNAFQNLKKLWELDVTNSFVKELKRSMFATPSRLINIDFSGNYIASLPDDLFSDMPNLQSLKLGNNKITTVSQAVFGNVHDGLDALHLEGNPIKCDCSVRWFLIRRRRIVYGKCVSPDDQKGHKLNELNVSDFDYCK